MRAEPFDHAGLQEELAAVVVQPGEDVLGEVFGQLQVGAGERGDHCGMVVAPLQGQAGQVDGGDPAFGAPIEGGDQVVEQRQLAFVAHQRGGFLQAEAHAAGSHFQQLTACLQAAEVQLRGDAGADRQGAAGRQGIQYLLDEAEHGGVLDHLELVEEDHERRLALAEQVQHVEGARLVGGAGYGGAFRQQVAQPVAEQGDEALQVVVDRVEVYPQGPPATGAAAVVVLLEQGGLAEAGGGADQDQPGVAGIFHLVEQMLALQVMAVAAGRGVLGGQDTDRRGPGSGAARGGMQGSLVIHGPCHAMHLLFDRRETAAVVIRLFHFGALCHGKTLVRECSRPVGMAASGGGRLTERHPRRLAAGEPGGHFFDCSA
ncbi:hypothetical protein D9M71_167560 [compost metagenome]